MECSYCGAELIYNDYYGVGNFAAQEKYGYGFEKCGDIFYCPNSEGFEDSEEAQTYIEQNNVEDTTVEDIVCESACFNGFFYTDKQENLHEGYPC